MGMTPEQLAEIERLIRETSEDDVKMTPAPWTWDDRPGEVYGDSSHADGRILIARVHDESLVWDCGAIARTRNNLAAVASHLEVARDRIAILETALREACDAIGNSAMHDEEMLARLRALADGVLPGGSAGGVQ